MVYEIKEGQDQLTLDDLRWILQRCEAGERVRVAAEWVRAMRRAVKP